MIYNYTKIIFRNFLNDKMYTFIIVFGLAIGIAVCLMIAQYIHFELSFDRNVEDRDRIHYVYMKWGDGPEDVKCSPAVGPFFKNTIPEVESAVRIIPVGLDEGSRFTLRREGDGKIIFYSQEHDLFLADAEVLRFFSIPIVIGNAETALLEPNTMVITQNLAEKFFPREDPINKTLIVQINNLRLEYRITGITENPTSNSSIQFNALFSMATLKTAWDIDNQWIYNEFQTFVKLHAGSDFASIEQRINEAAKPLRVIDAQLNSKLSIHISSFTDFHFFRHKNPITTSGIQFTGDRKLITYFAILAGLVLTISWGNYINLTTARALRRAKEVGLRKVNGASRKNLVVQFLIEFLFINMVSILLAFTIAQLLFSIFAQTIGSDAKWIFWTNPLFWLVIVLFLFVSTMVSGIYPAFIMSNYKPSTVLKGNFSRSQSGTTVRRGLVLVQFGMSVFMIMSIYVISRQLFFMQRQDLGMAIDQVVVIRTNEINLNLDRFAAFQQWKSKIENLDYVKGVSAADVFPGENKPRGCAIQLSSDAKKVSKVFLETVIGEDYFQTMGLELLYGTDFSTDQSANLDKVVINERGARDLGFSNSASVLGEQITLPQTGMKYTVIGVVKDFRLNLKIHSSAELFHKRNFYDPKNKIYSAFLVKLSTDDLNASIAKMEKEWKLLFSDAPFDYFFLDSYFDTFYKEEQHFAGVFGFFSVIGILITCMGLFGLSLYDTNSRAKEIGVRKTLGASVKSIVWLFSRDYMKLVLSASLVGIPAGIFLLNEWLKNYPLRINLQTTDVLWPLVIMFLVAIVTVGYHTFKTANMDPVKSLRNE